MFKKIKKNKYYRMTLVLILIFIVLTGIFVHSLRKERIKNRDITAIVQPDGKVVVQDIWDVNIVNSSTLYQSFDFANKDNFTDIKVSSFDKTSNTWVPMKLNENISSDGKEKLNHFHADRFQGKFEIAWGVGLERRRDRRKYKIEYTVNGPVTNYLDIAEYNHMFVGRNFSIPIENFRAIISFPSPVDAKTASIWGHGAPSGEINFVNGKVEVKANKIPANTFIEGRVIFPKKLVPKAPEIKIDNKENILKEERTNTIKTMVAMVNDENRSSLITKATLAILLYLGIILTYQMVQISKIKKEFPEGFVRKWGRYTDFPQTKLNILAANVIYEDKGAMNFFIAVMLKLVQKKYMEIIPVNENAEGSTNMLDESFIERIKDVEKACTELGIPGNPIEIANILKDVEKSIRAEKAKQLHISLKDLEKVRYKLNIRAISEAEKSNKLEVDEKEVIYFLTFILKTSQLKDEDFQQKVKRAIENNNSSLPTRVFEQSGIPKDKTKEALYIEQHQLIGHLITRFAIFVPRYKALIEKEKGRETIAGIYSLAKEEQYKSLKFNPVIPIILLGFFVYLLLTKLVGTLQLNEPQYIIATGLTLIASLMIIFSQKRKGDILKPHLTEEGKNIKEEYQGLFNFLNNDSFIAEYPEESIVIWGGFLVLATYFGIASKVFETLRKTHPKVVEELQRSNSYYSDSSSGSLWNMMDYVDALSDNIVNANMMAKDNERRATMKSTSGSRSSFGGGGGFTSGGGGGFGGGGGGSR